ncbi:hypothetical protein [Streptomyces sp. NPDC087525]|uniref:hypothetical protein n=1 Tax=Streptomyces sp. NPDC087525 TaxID=3365793 RepID=UPI0038033BFB
MTDFDQDDIAAMRRENGGEDLKRFLRDQLRAGRTRRETPPTPAPPPRPPGHRPGAWPTGISPPGPPVQRHPPSAWATALDEYRDWLTTADHPERLDSGQICGCTACTPNNPEENR